MAEHLPPSPPPSPPRRRHKKKHVEDPFLDLSTPLPSPDLPTDDEDDDHDESLFSKYILTPLLFTSFLISLFLVNLSDRLRRTRANHHPNQNRHTGRYNAILRYIYPSAWLDLDPEPYQDPHTGAWNSASSTTSTRPPGQQNVLNPKGELQTDSDVSETSKRNKGKHARKAGRNAKKRKPWFLRKKIRKVTKLELNDAFAMRGRIMVGMLVVGITFLMGVIMGVRWTMQKVW